MQYHQALILNWNTICLLVAPQTSPLVAAMSSCQQTKQTEDISYLFISYRSAGCFQLVRVGIHTVNLIRWRSTGVNLQRPWYCLTCGQTAGPSPFCDLYLDVMQTTIAPINHRAQNALCGDCTKNKLKFDRCGGSSMDLSNMSLTSEAPLKCQKITLKCPEKMSRDGRLMARSHISPLIVP